MRGDINILIDIKIHKIDNMGPYLTVPRKEKESEDGADNKVGFSPFIMVIWLIF